MSRLAQVLLLDPAHELRFQGPFKSEVTSHLTLSNPTDNPVAFKVKTTAPKRYCVRPNSGVIDPNQSMRLVVILRSSDKDQPLPADQTKDKFMVQSVVCDHGATAIENVFKEAPQEKLMDSKIRCVFDWSANVAGDGVEQNKSGRQSEERQVEEVMARAKEVPGDYGSAVETIALLREENSRLLREKLDLQEEASKLRKRAAAATAATSSSLQKQTQQQQQQFVDNKPPGVNLTMEILAVAFLVTFFIALFIGKTVL